MSNAKHTASPWVAIPIDDTGWILGRGKVEGADYIADVHKATHERSDEESEANVRLMTAAPELLAELVDLHPADIHGGNKPSDCRTCAAIAKARGEK